MEGYEQRVTKLKSAERQLREAIRLFFEQRDSVPIFTLAAAAHQTLHDLCRNKGIKGLMDVEFVAEKYKSDWIKAIKGAAAFFKHADRDPEEIKSFDSEMINFVIMDSISMYQAFTKNVFFEIGMYKVWFFLRYPTWMTFSVPESDDDVRNMLLEGCEDVGLTYKDYSEFLNILKERNPWEVRNSDE